MPLRISPGGAPFTWPAQTNASGRPPTVTGLRQTSSHGSPFDAIQLVRASACPQAKSAKPAINHETRILILQLAGAAGLAVVAGSALGLLMAYVRGWIDEVVMRGVDVVMTIPPLILSLLVLGGVGASYPVIIGTVAFFFAARVATVIRAAALDVVSEDFVTAARLRGESAVSIARREFLPNVTSSMLVEFSLRTGYAVLFIAGLSFLGFGSAPPTPDWGLMINEGRQYISSAQWLVLAPSLALASLVVGLSLFTDGIGDALGLSPTRRKQS